MFPDAIVKKSFWTQHMMRCLIMITAKQMILLRLLILTGSVEGHLFIKVMFPLTVMTSRCPKITCKGGSPHCTCENPCSDAKYGRNVHFVLKDNPRLFNNPPRGSEEWKLEYNARTSAERCNKRKKIDYKLEDGRYRSSKMWYCRLFATMMYQHLDAWTLPKTSPLKDLFEQAA